MHQKGCKKSHNVLLHIENSEKSDKATGIATASENSIASCTVAQARRGALQVLEIGLRNGSSEAKAWALCDTGSTHSWVSEQMRSEMGLKGSHEVVFVRGVTGTIEGSTQCVVWELFSLEDNKFVPLKFFALVRRGLYLDNEKLDLRNLKHDCSHLKHVVADVIDHYKISVILCQKCSQPSVPSVIVLRINIFYGPSSYPSAGLLADRCLIANN